MNPNRHDCRTLLWSSLIVCLAIAAPSSLRADFPEPTNSQKPGEHPPEAVEALKKIKLPEGFHVSLFAAEPHVQQPIAFEIDDRGRLWVVENYTYAGRGYDKTLRDRVIILEDSDHDGQFDKRKVFWEQGNKTTGITLGFGGVWLLNNGKLIFIADEDKDDKPDVVEKGNERVDAGKTPQVLLDGFDVERANHNIVNGLMWGPDGWLYGRHGILGVSYVGKPGTPKQDRQYMNCGIWRYHPTRNIFEPVAHGTTNPWGLDYNEHGELFMTNNVIGHLWHVVPGAHYERMYGSHPNPHLYELMKQTADHYHWDTGQKWHQSRDGKGRHGELGGGHSHCGGMIYLGDNWPKEYRGDIFMCNTHGRRVNRNKLVIGNNGEYVGKRAPDFMFANESWFRGVELKYGPDGAVYIADWSDFGECHDADGVHRLSGRIYKVWYGPREKLRKHVGDLAGMSDRQLVDLLKHENAWFARRAMRLLQERAVEEDEPLPKVLVDRLKSEVEKGSLRALWTLHRIGAEKAFVFDQVFHDDPRMVAWAHRFNLDRGIGLDRIAFAELSKVPVAEWGVLRLHWAGGIAKMREDDAWGMANLLATTPAPDDGQWLRLLWYGIEPRVAEQPNRALEVLQRTRFPKLRRFIARRITSEIDAKTGAVSELLAATVSLKDSPAEVLLGMTEALRGRRKAPMPEAWPATVAKLKQRADYATIEPYVTELSIVFGGGIALSDLRKLAGDGNADNTARRNALNALIRARDDKAVPILHKLTRDRTLNVYAVQGLANYDHPGTPKAILDRVRGFKADGRRAIVETLSSRPRYALALLNAVEQGKIEKHYITAAHARQMRGFNDPKVNAMLDKTWGVLRESDKDKQALIAKYKAMLTPELLRKADLPRGRVLFNQVCASCHKLYGQGGPKEGNLGPDITGANRDSLDYLLANILDPSSAVPEAYRVSNVNMKDGRVVSGIITASSEQTVTVQTVTQRLVLDRGEVESIKATPMSMMPEGLLQPLKMEQVRDLIGYLMSKRQVDLPKEK